MVPDKVWWTLVDFAWHNGRWEYSKDMDDVSVGIKDVDSPRNDLIQLAANEANTMMGFWMALDGNNKNM